MFIIKQWRQAIIEEIDGEKLFLSFLKFDCQIQDYRYSRAIAPFESKTKLDYEWRDQLLSDESKLPVQVDALGYPEAWKVAKITALRRDE